MYINRRIMNREGRALERELFKRESGDQEKRDSSHPQADAFAGAKAEEKIGLLRSE
jgi:hypothetical protein